MCGLDMEIVDLNMPGGLSEQDDGVPVGHVLNREFKRVAPPPPSSVQIQNGQGNEAEGFWPGVGGGSL